MDVRMFSTSATQTMKLNEMNTKAATIKEFTLEQVSSTAINRNKKKQKQSQGKKFERLFQTEKDSDPSTRQSLTHNIRVKIQDHLSPDDIHKSAHIFSPRLTTRRQIPEMASRNARESQAKKLNICDSFRPQTQSPIFYQPSSKFGIPTGNRETNPANFVAERSSYMKIGSNLQKSAARVNTSSNTNPRITKIIESLPKVKMQNILLNSALKDPFETQDEPSLDSITFSNVDINKGDLTNYREQLLSPVTNLSVSMSINQTASLTTYQTPNQIPKQVNFKQQYRKRNPLLRSLICEGDDKKQSFQERASLNLSRALIQEEDRSRNIFTSLGAQSRVSNNTGDYSITKNSIVKYETKFNNKYIHQSLDFSKMERGRPRKEELRTEIPASPHQQIEKGMKLFSPQHQKRPNYFSVLSQNRQNSKDEKEICVDLPELPQISKPASIQGSNFDQRMENPKSMDRARLTLRTVLSKPKYTIEHDSTIQEEKTPKMKLNYERQILVGGKRLRKRKPAYDYLNDHMDKDENKCLDPQAENDYAGIMEFLRCRPAHVNQTYTRAQMRKFLQHMDNLLINDRYQKRAGIARIKRLLEEYVNDTDPIRKRTADEEQNLIDQLQKLILSFCYIDGYHNRLQNFYHNKRNYVIHEMLADSKNVDQNFVKQIEEARPATKEFMNSLIETLNEKKIDEELEIDEMSTLDKNAAVHTHEDAKSEKEEKEEDQMAIRKQVLLMKKKQALKHQNTMGDNLMSLFGGQKPPSRKGKLSEASASSEGSQSADTGKNITDIIENEIGRSPLFKKTMRKNRPLAKFQQVVERNFLTRPLAILQESHMSKISFMFSLQMSHFKMSLGEILPEENPSLYSKYAGLHRNLYENDFIHQLLEKVPALKGMVLIYDAQEDQDDGAGESKKKNQARDCYNTPLNELFDYTIDKNKFYTHAKRGNLRDEDQGDVNNLAMIEYFKYCYGVRIIPIPTFVTFEKNVMYLSNQSLSHQEGVALREYLRSTRNLVDKRVHKLIIDSCQIKDESLAEILIGIESQTHFSSSTGRISRQFLYSFIISNANLGPKAVAILENMMPELIEVTINNIPQNYLFNKQLQETLLNSVWEKGEKLLKLKFANINLNHGMMPDYMAQLIQHSEILQLIDVSWTQLTVPQLVKITKALTFRYESIRHINLSYNKLYLKETDQERELSIQVITNLCELFSKSFILCHVKLSGMDFTKPELLELCKIMFRLPLVMSIHLNDNEINRNQDTFSEVLDIFGIREEDLIELNRQSFNQKSNIVNELETSQLRLIKTAKGAININYQKVIQEYLHSSGSANDGQELNNINKQRNLYKDHILMGKHSKIIEQQRAINLSTIQQGIARIDDNGIDPFVVTRKVNYPEFIFNQRVKNDTHRTKRYFEKDHEFQWKLSKKNECFICEKYKYTLIFYEKGPYAKNHELIEIHDQEFLRQMKRDFYRNYLHYKTLAPIICGTVVNHGYNQGTFERKLKMMRASLFTLLSIAHSREFSNTLQQQKFIKDGIISINSADTKEVLDEINIWDKIDGWGELLHDKCNRNELVDVTSVNQPNLKSGYLEYNDYYVYANFLKPGYHQFIIYDPEQDRAFCKHIVVSLNQKDFYPEFPLMFGYDAPKTIQNVWRTWLEDTFDDQVQSFLLDTSQEEFQIWRYIKDPKESKKCLDIMRDNFDLINIFHKECLVSSDKFPQINWERISYNILIKTQEESPVLRNRKIRLTRAELELSFIASTRFDDTKGLKSAMQRMELIEFILRVGKNWIKKVYPKAQPSEHLSEFLNVFLTPTHDESRCILHRKVIRGSSKVNQLLFDNLKSLEALWVYHKASSLGFTKDSASALFYHGLESFTEIELSLRDIEESFLFAMMTVLNEHRNMNKYFYLLFVEFLEMLCRIAIVGIKMQETVDYKVFLLLDIIFQKKYDDGIWDPKQFKLRPIVHE